MKLFLIPIIAVVAFVAGCSQPIQTVTQTYTTIGIGVSCFAQGGGTLYAGLNDSLFLSQNNGANWQYAGNVGSNNPILSLLDTNGALFAGTDSGAFVSANSGATWTAINAGLLNISIFDSIVYIKTFHDTTISDTLRHDTIVHDSNIYIRHVRSATVTSLALFGGNLFAATTNGVFISSNNGANWAVVDSGLPYNNTDSAFVATALTVIGGTLYTCIYNYGLFYTANNGVSWTPVTSGMGGESVYSFAQAGTNVYAGAGNGVFVSSDNGADWAIIDTGLTNTIVNSLAVVGGANVYAATQYGGVFMLSTNGSIIWNPENNGFPSPLPLISALIVSGGNLVAGTSGGVYVSQSGLSNWTFTGL